MSSAWTALPWVPGEQQQRPVKQAAGRGAPMTRPLSGFAAGLHRCLFWSHRLAGTYTRDRLHEKGIHMDHTTSRTSDGVTTRTAVQKAALAVGVVFLIVGVAGFIPGLTTNYSDLSFAGHDSEAMLLGIFQVSILHNIVHLLFGIAGIAAARTWSASRGYLIGGGIIYLVLWLYGLFIDKESSANLVPVNSADDWLHLVLGLGMIALGAALSRRRVARTGHDEIVGGRPRGTY
jgi:hypothetical protein